jgi:DNA-binding transcriptional LysR family regulator
MRKLPDLEQITAFLAVAEELSFRRAAGRLCLDQSALSRRVKDLEARLGFQLFFRTTHTVRLTDAGRTFYEANQRIVESLGGAVDAAARVARGSQGRLRVAYMTFATAELLPAAVASYSQAYPDVSIVLSYQRTQLQKVSLARGEIDVGLLLGPFEHPDFDTLEVSRERSIALLASKHPLAAKRELTVRDVAESPLVIGNDQQWDYYRQLISGILGAHGYRPNIAFEAPSLFGILGLVRGGLGVTIVPEVMRDFCPQDIVARRIVDAEYPIVTIAAWRRPADQTVNAFVKVLRSVVKSRQRPARRSTELV